MMNKKHQTILVIMLMTLVFSLGFINMENPVSQKAEVKNPLLLNSGLVEAQEAEIRVVLWFAEGKPQKAFIKDLPQDNWLWQESGSPNSLTSGYSLAGYTLVSPEEEAGLFAWYLELAQVVKAAGGIVYLDERIDENIDIIAFALKQNIQPQQYSLTEGVVSVAGWDESLGPEVLAGKDRVNIQLISKVEGKGKTALAFPVLLEEF